MFLTGHLQPVPCPDPEAGLYIRTRQGAPGAGSRAWRLRALLCHARQLAPQHRALEGQHFFVCHSEPSSGLVPVLAAPGEVVRVALPEDHLGYQVGEAMQIHSGGTLLATPHAVAAPRPALSGGISRNTLAVFMQPRWVGGRGGRGGVGGWGAVCEPACPILAPASPAAPGSCRLRQHRNAAACRRWDVVMDAPPGVDASKIGVGQWQPGVTFGEFSGRTLAAYH